MGSGVASAVLAYARLHFREKASALALLKDGLATPNLALALLKLNRD